MASSACYFSKCCFCIPLETGCFIIGYLNLIGSLIATILTGIGLGATIAVTNDPRFNNNVDVSAVAIAVVAIVLLLMILSLAFSIVLLVGLHKNKPGHVKAYLIYTAVFLAIFGLLFIISLTSGQVAAKDIVGKLIQLLLSAYFMLVIRSHYINMKGNNIQTA